MAAYDFGNFDFGESSDISPDFSAVYGPAGGTEVITGHQVNVPKVVFSGLICAFGLIGNMMVIFVILVLQEYKKSVTHWYVLQLAIADSLFLLTLPFKMVEDMNGRWIYSEWMCKAKETLLFLNYYASILFLMIMSLDRYIAVCHTFSTQLQKLRKPVVSVMITAVTWLVSLLICIPIMLYSFKVGIKGSCICSYRFPPDPVNETARCLENGYTTDRIDECLKIGQEPSGPEPYCTDLNIHFNLSALGIEFGGSLGNIDLTGGGGDGGLGGLGGFGGIGGFGGMGNTSSGNSDNSTGIGFPGIGMPVFPPAPTTPTATMTTVPQYNFEAGIAPECHYWTRPRGWTIFNVFNFIVMFLLPFLVMVACYGLIIHRLSTTRMRTVEHAKQPTTDVW
uniref:C3a anaphylatoxin chemotactic receptor n=1 Tax=Ciona intestinalis TaxID=7719 RepID=F6UJQ0_CIOIN|nr:C3a anaphylatoxin chemotactic receptor [Ciona intestinalis]|eukprot:XP_018672649.1 C3a anaphylatoxin chemotactic receptor [Ciona intestinalis]